MRELIYYPSIKILDNNWLKFALLYIDKLHIIVPSELEIDLYEQNQMIKNSSDLLIAEEPTQQDKAHAAIKFGDQLNRMKSNIGLNPNLNPTTWHNSSNYNYKIYLGKIHDTLQENLIKENLAIKSDDGIILGEKAATLYMWCLADTMSKQLDIATVSDSYSADYNQIQQYLKLSSQQQMTTFQYGTDLPLPSLLSEIPLKEIIDFRNSESNIRLRSEFHEAIKNLEILKTESISEMTIVNLRKDLEEVKSQYYLKLLKKFSFVAGMYVFKNFDFEKLPDFLSQFISENNTIGLNQIGSLSFREFRTNQKAIDYITRIDDLSSKYKHLNI